MKQKLRWLFIVLLISYRLASGTDGDKISLAEQYYQQALVSFNQGNEAQAITQLKTAIKLCPKFAKAHNQLALIYMNKGTVEGRFKATTELEQAIKLEPGNIEFRLNEALLNLKKGFSGIAAKNFERILELDPRNYMAYYHLAQIKEAEALRYKNMISVDEASNVIIPMSSFAERAKELAIHYYQKAISIQPKSPEPYYRLAMLYFEFQDYFRMIELLESAIRIIPDNKNCFLFLGFAHQTVKNYHQAAQAYQKARSLMSPDELELLQAVESVLPLRQRRQYLTMSAEEQAQFRRSYWVSQDPFFLTEFNERQMEHLRRMAYANLRFSNPDAHLEGWQTDQGKVLIRYGFPLTIYRTRPFIGSTSNIGMNPLHHSREIWTYPGFDFIFEDRFLSDHYAFAWGYGQNEDDKIKFERLIAKMPELYEFVPDTERLDVRLDPVAFWGAGEKTELELCFALPIQPLRPVANRFKLRHGVFLFDDQWNPVLQNRRELSFQPDEIRQIAGKLWYGDHETLVVQPGNYVLAFEFEDVHSGRLSQIRRQLKVEHFSSQRFQMSEILFASEIKGPSSIQHLHRSDFQILPNPMRIYRSDEPLAIYYELYHLQQDQNGEMRFRVEYRISPHHAGEGIAGRILSGLGLKRPLSHVASMYEYSGNEPNERQHLTIVVPNQLKGTLKLTLIATDLITGDSVQREGVFWKIE
ncbi:MAG: tetratricopeptide repeat protein [candidate division KSB1 bacterium]|nr:tetratricopeptide repeat protein [candidate division KSB1 bacterium]MDZ7402112.1 tetratricopeptide repeat protein [candidate division KSB1 bacterium]